MLTKEQIKKSSEKAVKNFHIPAGWGKETWEHNMLMCIKTEMFVPNAVRNQVEIKEAVKQAEKKK